MSRRVCVSKAEIFEQEMRAEDGKAQVCVGVANGGRVTIEVAGVRAAMPVDGARKLADDVHKCATIATRFASGEQFDEELLRELFKSPPPVVSEVLDRLLMSGEPHQVDAATMLADLVSAGATAIRALRTTHGAVPRMAVVGLELAIGKVARLDLLEG